MFLPWNGCWPCLRPTSPLQIDWPRALLRGRYMQSVAAIEFNGVPIELDLHTKLLRAWPDIKDQLIAEVDQDFGVYENESFKAVKFEHYLVSHCIPWPRLPSSTSPSSQHVSGLASLLGALFVAIRMEDMAQIFAFSDGQ